MKQPRILIYDSEDEMTQSYRDFHFVHSQASGVYIIDENTMGISLNGDNIILEYNQELFNYIKENTTIQNLINKN